jgi:hypothetical protein
MFGLEIEGKVAKLIMMTTAYVLHVVSFMKVFLSVMCYESALIHFILSIRFSLLRFAKKLNTICGMFHA